jgi:hypothetical protein
LFSSALRHGVGVSTPKLLGVRGGGLARKAIKGTRDRTNKGVGGRPEWSIGGDMFICWGTPCSLRAAG